MFGKLVHNQNIIEFFFLTGRSILGTLLFAQTPATEHTPQELFNKILQSVKIFDNSVRNPSLFSSAKFGLAGFKIRFNRNIFSHFY